MCPVGGHSVGGSHSTQGYGVFVGAFVAHNSHGAYCGEEDGTCLPYLVVKHFAVVAAVVEHRLDVDIVSLLEDSHLLTGDVAKDTHSKTWSWERVALDKTFGHLQLVAYTTYFVLEEPLQRFAEF